MPEQSTRTGTAKLSSLQRVKNAAAELALEIEIKTMEQSTRTAQEAADACGCDVAQIVKSLIFENSNDGALTLVLVAGNNVLDTAYISMVYGLKLKRCDTRRVRAETGFAIGGVAPIGHLKPITTYMDQSLLTHDLVWAAAGRPDSVFSVDPKALCDAIDGQVIDVGAPD